MSEEANQFLDIVRAGNMFGDMKTTELERQIKAGEYLLGNLLRRDPMNNEIDAIKEAIYLMQLARGKGEVM